MSPAARPGSLWGEPGTSIGLAVVPGVQDDRAQRDQHRAGKEDGHAQVELLPPVFSLVIEPVDSLAELDDSGKEKADADDDQESSGDRRRGVGVSQQHGQHFTHSLSKNFFRRLIYYILIIRICLYLSLAVHVWLQGFWNVHLASFVLVVFDDCD